MIETTLRPLDGVLVVDFSRILAGPFATMALADLGARVIKVERPDVGDDTRAWSPPTSETGSTYFDSVNRNKESIELDLADPEGRSVAFELARRADVVVENFRPGTMARYGLAYEDLTDVNPGVIYASISGFGSGEGSELPGYDFLVQAVGGLMSITGEAQGLPTKVGVALVDVLTGKDVQVGILAALHQRSSTGRGSCIEVNLLSSLQGSLVNQGQAFLSAGVLPTRMGNIHPSIAPYELLECKSGSLAVACGNDAQFRALCHELDRTDLGEDPQFETNALRVANREPLARLLEIQLSTATPEEWAERLMRAGVPAGPVLSIDGGLQLARTLGLEPTIELKRADGSGGGIQIRSPLTWQPAPAPRVDAPPVLGQHNDSIRDWLKKTSEEHQVEVRTVASREKGTQ
jgi:crotonobetainyl-CoA:carnitine CoA-transferase CaiB-like acyl-CoA transferase